MASEWSLAPSEQFIRELQQLCHFAQAGDDRALMFVAEISKVSTFLLHQVAMDDPERLRPLASRDIAWPAFIGPKRGTARMNQHLIKVLRVGKDSPYAGKWKPTSPATATAMCMAFWLESNQERLALAPLSAATQQAWFEVGWQRLLLATDGAPEAHSYLYEIGKSAVGKRSTSRGMSQQTPGMQRDDVRAKIKENISKSFRSLTGAGPEK